MESLVKTVLGKRNTNMVMYLNGAYNAMTEILYTSGASSMLLEAVVPYAKSASKERYRDFIIQENIAAVSQDVADGLARSACHRAIELNLKRIHSMMTALPLNSAREKEVKLHAAAYRFVGVGVSADYNTKHCYFSICIFDGSKFTLHSFEKKGSDISVRKALDEYYSMLLLETLSKILTKKSVPQNVKYIMVQETATDIPSLSVIKQAYLQRQQYIQATFESSFRSQK